MAYRYEDYPGGERPWLDRPDALEAIARRLQEGEISEHQAGQLRQWVEQGYLVVEGLLGTDLAERINADVQAIYDEHKDEPLEQLREYFKNAYHGSEATCEALVQPDVLSLLDLLLGKRVIPHQTLNLPVSSQQAAHSDQILMTTNPIGYTIAVWFALETIDEECGPLLVYPGSHRLPYISAETVGIPREADPAERSRVYDENYYHLVAEQLAENGIAPKPFVPKQGDVLIWHANLLHAAARIERTGATRRSLIAHYFAEEAEHYSDLFGWACISPDLRPAG